jgi:hypothetical protein
VIDTGEKVLIPFTALWHEGAELADYVERMTADDVERVEIDKWGTAEYRHTHRATCCELRRKGEFVRYDKADRLLTACGVSLALFELAHGGPIFSRRPPVAVAA